MSFQFQKLGNERKNLCEPHGFTEILTAPCFTVGLARTLAVPDS